MFWRKKGTEKDGVGRSGPPSVSEGSGFDHGSFQNDSMAEAFGGDASGSFGQVPSQPHVSPFLRATFSPLSHTPPILSSSTLP